MLPVLLAACAADPRPHPAPPDEPPPPAVPPDVLIVLLDDVGTDKVGAYAEHPHPAHTPNLDALAAQGVLFRNAWATPSCSPSRAELLTGRYPRRMGIGRTVNAYRDRYELRPAEVTLPELLDLAPVPWDTSEIGKWHLATYDSPDNVGAPGDQGFAWYRSVVSNLNEGSPRGRKESYFRWQQDDNGVLRDREDYVTTDQIDDAIQRIHAMSEPWLLYLALSAPHTPLVAAPPELAGPNDDVPAGVARLYYQTLEAADTELGRLFAEVDLERTLVICAGDNGTPDFAILPPSDPEQSKLSMFEGGINVPLLIAGPGVAAGEESDALASLVDVFPTVAALAGVPLDDVRDPAGAPIPIDGHSLLRELVHPHRNGQDYVYAEQFAPLGYGPYISDWRAVRDARWKLVSNAVTGTERLLDLQGRDDDGPDLLRSPLSPEADEAYRRLSGVLAGYGERLTPL